jgi:hypothetical protein
MVPSTLASAVVVCRLLPSSCRESAAGSPPASTACGIRADVERCRCRRSVIIVKGHTATRRHPSRPGVAAAPSGQRAPACLRAWTPTATRRCGSWMTCECRSPITRPSARSGWSSSNRRSPAAARPGRRPGVPDSAQTTSPPPASKAITRWRSCANCSKATPGSQTRQAPNSYRRLGIPAMSARPLCSSPLPQPIRRAESLDVSSFAAQDACAAEQPPPAKCSPCRAGSPEAAPAYRSSRRDGGGGPWGASLAP